MTDNKIIKALECCGSPYNRCLECPLCETERVKCITEMSANALNLINRQEAEIDFVISSKNLAEASINKLKVEIDLAKAFHQEAVAERDLLSIKLKKAKTEIERLQKENEILSANADNAFQEGLNENRELFKEEVEKDIKAEAIKEFVESLKTIAMVVQIGPDPKKKHKVVTAEGIDTIAKKWLGDTNAEA